MRRRTVLGTAALLAAACGLLLEGAAATPDMAHASPSPGPYQGEARGPDANEGATAPAPPDAPAPALPAPAAGPPAVDALGRTQPVQDASVPAPAAGPPSWFAATAAALVLLLVLVLPGILLVARRPVEVVRVVPLRDDGR